MIAYLYAPAEGYHGEGIYGLIAEDGEPLGSHFCSNSSYARHDLTDFPSRRIVIEAKGVTEVRWLGDDDTTWSQLLARNTAWYEANKDRARADHGGDMETA